MNLIEKVHSIESREDLSAFITCLLHDLEQNGESWENATLDSYLEALAAWIADMDGYYLNKREAIPAQPTWKAIGEMLMAAKMYEKGYIL